MSSVSSFVNKNQQVLCDEYNAIINCETDTNEPELIPYRVTFKSGKNLFLLTEKTDFVTRASLCTNAIQKCQQMIREIDLCSEAERNELSEFEGEIKKLKNYFECERTFSGRYSYFKTNGRPIIDLSLKVGSLGIGTTLVSSVLFTVTHGSPIAPIAPFLQGLALTTLALNTLLLIPFGINKSWNNMISKHLVVAEEAAVLIKSLKKKIKSSVNIETSKVEIVKKESPIFAANDVESKGFSFNQKGAIAEQSQSGAMAGPFQNVEVKGFSFGSSNSGEAAEPTQNSGVKGFSFGSNNDEKSKGFSFGSGESAGLSFNRS